MRSPPEGHRAVPQGVDAPGISRPDERRGFLGAIRPYYDEAWVDYRLVWAYGGTGAMHFGYYEPGIRRHRAAVANANRVIADLCGMRPGSRVLDAGCGVGGTATWLALQRGAEVVGITPVATQIRAARDRARALGLDGRVTFVRADYTRTDLPPGSFDAVFALESLCHAPDKAAFYREAYRLLRPGGRIAVAEYVRAARPLPPPGEAMVRRWLDGWAIPDLDTAAEHVAAAAAAGFAAVRLEDATYRSYRSLRRLYHLSFPAWPVSGALRAVGLRSAVQHGNVIASRLQFRALNRGYWFYGLLTGVRQ